MDSYYVVKVVREFDACEGCRRIVFRWSWWWAP